MYLSTIIYHIYDIKYKISLSKLPAKVTRLQGSHHSNIH